jgi:hypothetical protein
MPDEFAGGHGDAASGQFAVDTHVLVFPGTAEQQGGVIIEDFGESAGQAVDIGTRVVRPARRWAVRLNNGDLVFVDSDQLSPL